MMIFPLQDDLPIPRPGNLLSCPVASARSRRTVPMSTWDLTSSMDESCVPRSSKSPKVGDNKLIPPIKMTEILIIMGINPLLLDWWLTPGNNMEIMVVQTHVKRWFEKILPNFEASLGFFCIQRFQNIMWTKTYGSHKMTSSSHWLKTSPPWCHGLCRFFFRAPKIAFFLVLKRKHKHRYH